MRKWRVDLPNKGVFTTDTGRARRANFGTEKLALDMTGFEISLSRKNIVRRHAEGCDTEAFRQESLEAAFGERGLRDGLALAEMDVHDRSSRNILEFCGDLPRPGEEAAHQGYISWIEAERPWFDGSAVSVRAPLPQDRRQRHRVTWDAALERSAVVLVGRLRAPGEQWPWGCYTWEERHDCPLGLRGVVRPLFPA